MPRWSNSMLLCVVIMMPLAAYAQDATSIATFHSIGLYWSPTSGSAERGVDVRFRPEGGEWRDGLAMRWNPIDGTEEDLTPYRGSLVHLEPGTRYEVQLDLEGTSETTTFFASTWSETFPEGEVVAVADSSEQLLIEESGTPDAYRVFDGAGATLDVGTDVGNAIQIDASFVIVRNLMIRGGSDNAIRILGGHDIVIEDCEMTAWGGLDFDGDYGQNMDAAVFSSVADLTRVVIQRCRMHHPNQDSNNWTENNCHSPDNCTYHPAGPQAIVFYNTAGNHVFRYNEAFSDADHYFNDIFGGGSNGSYGGFPGHDSDIYGNYLANCWDDGIESEGGNRNVRVWGNYVEQCFMAYANAATSIGPLYYWRNVSGQCWEAPGEGHAYFMKMGYAGSEDWMTGHMYLFHNTILNVDDFGCGGLGGSSRFIHHAVTRNNILHVRSEASHSISTREVNSDNDYDYDLSSATVPDGHEAHGLNGVPDYAVGAFDSDSMSGDFSLLPTSLGYDTGSLIPNFNDNFLGAGPDMGAHEADAQPPRYGLAAAEVCEPVAEVCDNETDDDCDGFVDEGCGLELSVLRCWGTPAIDGNLEEFADAETVTIEREGLRMVARALWDGDSLYLGFDVSDTDVRGHVAAGEDGAVWRDDAVELYIDPLDDGGTALQPDDQQIVVSALGALYQTFEGAFQHAVVLDGTISDDTPDVGFQIEVALPWTALGVTPVEGLRMGADIAVDDRDAPDDGTTNGAEYQTYDWAGLERYAVPELWGTFLLVDSEEPGDGGPPADADLSPDADVSAPDADGQSDDADAGPADGGSGDGASGGCDCSASGSPNGAALPFVVWLALG